MSKFSKQILPTMRENPPIPFVTKLKKLVLILRRWSPSDLSFLLTPPRQKPKMRCHDCDKNNHNTADCREIAKVKQHKKAQHGSKAVRGKNDLSFLFEEINSLKKQ
jgi:hypothetical protein